MKQVALIDGEIEASIIGLESRSYETGGSPTIHRLIEEEFQNNVFLESLSWLVSVFDVLVALAKRFIYGIGFEYILDNYSYFNRKQPVVDFPSVFFSEEGSNVGFSYKSFTQAEIEVSVPLERLGDAVDVVVDILTQYPIPVPLDIRYVKQSKALLSLQQHKMSATITMPSIQDTFLFADTFQVFLRIFDALYESDIPYAPHLAKQCPLNDGWVDYSFGDNLKLWKAKRRELLVKDETRRMFCNPLANTYGLCDLCSGKLEEANLCHER